MIKLNSFLNLTYDLRILAPLSIVHDLIHKPTLYLTYREDMWNKGCVYA